MLHVLEDKSVPLVSHQLFSTNQLEEARDQVSRIFNAHRVEVLDASQPLNVIYNHVRIGEISVSYADYGTDVALDPGVLENFYLVGMPLSGQSVICYGQETLVSDAATASVQSPLRPVYTEWLNGCRKLTIKISRKAIEKHAARLLHRPITKPIEFDVGMPLVDESGRTWLRQVEYLLRELSLNSPLLFDDHLREYVESMIVASLLKFQPSNYSQFIAASTVSAVPACVARVERFIANNYMEKCGLDELANIAGVSRRTLQDAFRRFHGMSPMQYVKTQRLEKAREELLHAGSAASVTEIALNVGFTHVGRFSNAYAARYGELPSQTLQYKNSGDTPNLAHEAAPLPERNIVPLCGAMASG